jgi:hypothetical protein
MAENSINNIIFKFEEYYDNDGAQELIAIAGVRGTVTVNAINLSDNKEGGDTRTLSEETPINEPLLRYIINDSTENLFTANFVTNDMGFVNIDITAMLQNIKFIKFYQKYKGKITFNVTIEIPKTDMYNVFVGNAKITPELKNEDNGIIFDSYNYYDQDDTIILSPISDKITDLATLRQTYKTAEANYLLIKKQFESQTVGDVDLEIDTVETYEPTTFKNVITRLLEFQVGTLQPAIEYTTTAKLTAELDRLNIINRLINNVCKMYPNITIEDGEGIPYDTGGQNEAAVDTGGQNEAAVDTGGQNEAAAP